MLQPRSLAAALLSILALGALHAVSGCSGGAAPSGPGSSSSTGAGGSGGGGTGGESIPPLDPAACPITADSGEDPAIAAAAEAQWSPAWKAPKSASVEQDKAFFLATMLGANATLLADLSADMALSATGMDRDQRLRGAPAKCVADVACLRGELAWTDAEAASTAEALRARLVLSGTLAQLAKDLRASGRFGLHATLDDSALVKAAFVDLTTALAATFDAEAAALGGAKLATVVKAVADAHPAPFVFFEPLVAVDLAALTADLRDEASRYEPLDQGENAAALAHIPSIDWAKFPFTAILVPGYGPDDPGVALSPSGQARADLAAARFNAGIAPLIVLSGGHVHPDRTPYSEAIEMKKYLHTLRGVPEQAMLVDPHARHTTTNLRNASRLLYRGGVPTDRPLLVTSDFGQSLYIGHWHGTFGPRCTDELGYLPWRSLVPLSDNDACMRPVAVSLHADGRDPLDP
ncbi:MAG: YdcF family protein [Byssovorax sp.]